MALAIIDSRSELYNKNEQFKWATLSHGSGIFYSLWGVYFLNNRTVFSMFAI